MNRLSFLLVYALTVLSIFLTPNSPFAAQEYTLTELYKLALERSETILIAVENIYISEQEKDKTMSKLLPTLSTTGSYKRYGEEKHGLQPEYTTSWGLKLEQSLSTGGREITAYRISKDKISKSRYELDAVKEEYLLDVASAYYSVLKSKKELDIARANVERLTKHRDATKTRFEVGEVTKTALLRAEAELSGAQSALIKTQNNLRLAKITLAKIVGLSGEFEIKEQSGTGQTLNSELFKTANCRPVTVDCLKERAISERVELKALAVERKISEDRVRYADGGYWPTISLESAYSRKEEHPATSAINRESVYATLTLNFPFFEGGLRRAEVREARAKLKQTGYRLSDLKKSISVDVENAYLSMVTESEALRKLEAQAVYARDNYNAVSRQFEYGLASSVDVMDANTLLVTAERQLATGRLDYQLTILKLQRAMGILLKIVTSQQSTVVSQGDKEK